MIHSNLDNADNMKLQPHNNYPGSRLHYSITGCLYTVSSYILNITVDVTRDVTSAV